jgi:hypothetical protein
VKVHVKHLGKVNSQPQALITLSPEEINPGTQRRNQDFFYREEGGGSTNSVEDRRQRERGSGGDSPLVRGFSQFANE